jgi:antitoxin YefM
MSSEMPSRIASRSSGGPCPRRPRTRLIEIRAAFCVFLARPFQKHKTQLLTSRPNPPHAPQGSQLTPAARLAASEYGKCSCRRCRLLPVVAADFAAELHSLGAARGGSTCGTMFLYGRGIVPTETTYSHARANFAAICDEAVSSTEAVIIHRRGAQDVALVSAAELRSLQETAHLLRSPKNAERLLAALKRARARSGTPQTPESLRREFGLAKEPSPRRRAR